MLMRVRPAQPLVAVILGAVLILSSAPAVLCLHSDGRTTIESGSDLCCTPVPGSTDRTTRLTGADGTTDGCPGCSDRALPSDGQRPRTGGDLMVSLPAAGAMPAPACLAGPAAPSSFSFLEEAASPPHAAPLRI